MWVSKAFVEELRTRDKANHENNIAQRLDNMRLLGENTRILIENQRLVSTLDWFKHRLTQVEMERAQLIYAATGRPDPVPQGAVKIATPNFVGEPRVSDVLNQQNNPFGDMGEDSHDPADQIPEQYQNLPRIT